MDGRSDAPLLTLAIPLYRSRRFLDVIAENIRLPDYPNLEILVGDRHLADDTVEQLRALFDGDTRLRFITASDELSWVEHYNLLLREGRGEYFLWMPHDDSYPADYVSRLVARLESRPGSVMAYGYCDAEDVNGARRENWPASPSWHERTWTARSALRLFFGADIGVAMRGVFRRATAVDQDLFLPATRHGEHSDTCWLFGLALLGRFEFVPETRCLKRFYPGSTHAQWKAPKLLELPRLQTRYVMRLVPSKRQRPAALAVLWAGALVSRSIELLNRLAGRQLVARPAAQRAFARVLAPWWR